MIQFKFELISAHYFFLMKMIYSIYNTQYNKLYFHVSSYFLFIFTIQLVAAAALHLSSRATPCNDPPDRPEQ